MYRKKKKPKGVSKRKHNALQKKFKNFKRMVFGIVTLGLFGGGFMFWKSKNKSA